MGGDGNVLCLDRRVHRSNLIAFHASDLYVEKKKYFVGWNTYIEIDPHQIMPKQKIHVINTLLEGLLNFAVIYI